jgi:ABC-type Fe3+ transport system permease subunit
MSDYSQKVTSTFNERMRLIRVRRRKEKLRFWDEFRIIPRWLMALVFVLFLAAEVIAYIVNTHASLNGGEMFPPELKGEPLLASLALSGIVALVSFFMATMIFMIAYVNRDAARRGMNSFLWTLLVLVLTPSSLIIGFVIYFLMREPLPYPCPQCSASVSARFNFCPNCKCNLQPLCPQCKREVAELDKFCPFCGTDLGASRTELTPQPSNV